MRSLLALLIGLSAAGASIAYRLVYRLSDDAGDWYWPFCAARALLSHGDPYGACPIVAGGVTYPPNALPTALWVLPLLPLGRLGPSLLWGVASGLLAWGCLEGGRRWRLLVFVSAPYWEAFALMQWSPLLLACALLPGLLPLVIIKPQIGIPVALMRWRWWTARRLLVVAVVAALSLALLPSWPLAFVQQATATYSGRPLLLAAPWLALALLRWREERARWLLLYSLVPVGGRYDLCPLLLACGGWRSALAWAAAGWGAWAAGWGAWWVATAALIGLWIQEVQRGDKQLAHRGHGRGGRDRLAGVHHGEPGRHQRPGLSAATGARSAERAVCGDGATAGGAVADPGGLLLVGHPGAGAVDDRGGIVREIYAVVYYAEHPKHGWRAYPTSCVASSEAEAIGLAIQLARASMPRAEGWVNHQAAATQVPVAFMERAGWRKVP